MRFPKGMNRKGTISELVQNIDYAPTFMELAGLEKPAEMQGNSLLPLLKGEKSNWRDAIYYHHNQPDTNT